MAEFDSVGAGFSRGIRTGANIAFTRREQKQKKQDAETKRTLEMLAASEKDAKEFIAKITEQAGLALQNGATEEQLQPFEDVILQAAVRHGLVLEEFRAGGQSLGVDMGKFPGGKAFVEQSLQTFGATVSAGRLMQITREQEGTREGEQTVDEATAILERDPTARERQKLAGVEETGPLISISNIGESALAKELGKLDAKTVVETEKIGQTAISTKREVARMSAAIESGRFKTGIFSGARLFLARMFDFVDVDPAEDSDLIGDAATADTLDAASARLGVDMAQKLGRITNMSLKFVVDALPNLTRTPEGNKILIEVMDRVADREIEIARLVNSYIGEFGSLRPPDRKSFLEASFDLDESDPVIDDALRKRIIEGSKKAPAKFSDIKGFVDSITAAGAEVPEGIPEGSVKVDRVAAGDVWETPDGRLLVDE